MVTGKIEMPPKVTIPTKFSIASSTRKMHLTVYRKPLFPCKTVCHTFWVNPTSMAVNVNVDEWTSQWYCHSLGPPWVTWAFDKQKDNCWTRAELNVDTIWSQCRLKGAIHACTNCTNCTEVHLVHCSDIPTNCIVTVLLVMDFKHGPSLAPCEFVKIKLLSKLNAQPI